VRITVLELLRRLAATDDVHEPVVEFGAARVARQAHLPSVRSLFPGRSFTGIDMNPGLGVDQQHDLRHLGLRDDSVGTALLLDTIEHVEDLDSAIAELHRCLAPDGVLLLTTHFFFPIHRFPSDYWRFTAEGITTLLGRFDRSYAGEAGLSLFPHTVVGLAGGPKVCPDRWRRLSGVIDYWLRNGAETWKERAMNVLPPALVEHGYRFYAMRSTKDA
jgi:SAM-dependent methyltransferase